MDALEHARAEIDDVDAQLAALFERRMAAVLQVAEYKRAHGLPIFDAAREAAVLEKAAARIQHPALRPYYKDHVQNMMDVPSSTKPLSGPQPRRLSGRGGGLCAHRAAALVPPRRGRELSHLGRGVRRGGLGRSRPRRSAL